MADKKAAPLFSLDPATLAGIEAVQKSPVFKAAANLQRQLPKFPDLSGVICKLPELGKLYSALHLEGYERFVTSYLPVDELLAVPADDSPLDEYVDAVAAVLAKHAQLSPWQVAMLILRAGGLSIADALSLHMGSIAKNPRNRGPSKTGGRALVEGVRTESKKRQWNTAWSWLCTQAENHAEVAGFQLDGVSDSGGVVRYSSGQKNSQGSIKKSTFQDYWGRPNRSKKAGK